MSNPTMEYLIKSTIILSVLYVSWLILLKNHITPAFQRFLFMMIVLLSLLLPVIKIPSGISIAGAWSLQNSPLTMYLDTFSQIENQITDLNSTMTFLEFTSLFWIIYWTGFSVLVFILILRLAFLINLIRDHRDNSIKKTKRIYLPSNTAPFSFFAYLFLPGDFNNHRYRDYILAHERVHSRQMHSLDIMLAEIFLAIHWFNPFAWFLRKTIAENHEYLADQGVISQGYQLKEYQMALLRETVNANSLTLTHHFKQPLIKKRIHMMHIFINFRYHNSRIWRILPVIFVIIFLSGINSSILPAKENPSFIYPLESGRITAKYGMMIHPFNKKQVLHRGLDIAAPKGSEVHSAAKGVVTETGFSEGAGNYIIIAHNSEFSSFYSHLDKILVTEHQNIAQNEIIALVGSTGLSTAPHLHFEIRNAGEAINPADFIDFSSLTN